MESTDTPLAAAREVLAELIGYPTISSEGNLELIAHLTQRLGAIGAACRMTTNEDGTKANLFATIGPEVDGGIVLSGHTDVVPVEGQDWSSDPFVARDEEGLIYGRGACDMKGFLACALALAPRFAEVELARPLHLAFTYDEEVGCLGARVMLEALVESGPKPAACIIGEPTEMRIIEGHKGCCEYTTEFTGLEGHGSRPEVCVNAVEYAARYVGELLSVRQALIERTPRGSPYEPPWTTVSVGRMAGGIAHNVVANRCEVDWEFRPVNNADFRHVREHMQAHVEQVLLPAMRAVDPQACVVTRTVGEVCGLEPMPDSEAVALAVQLTGGNTRGTVPFGTEAGLYQEIGIPTVVCGPGSIAQAHKPDEFVSHDQLAECLAMIERLVPRLQQAPCGG